MPSIRGGRKRKQEREKEKQVSAIYEKRRKKGNKGESGVQRAQ